MIFHIHPKLSLFIPQFTAATWDGKGHNIEEDIKDGGTLEIQCYGGTIRSKYVD